MTGLWKSPSSTLVPNVIRLVRAATQAKVSIGSYTEPKPSGASITGPPGPPMGIGTVGRISRSHAQTESRPIRSASSATCAIVWGDASLPATGRWTPSFTDVIGRSPSRCLLVRNLLVRTHRTAECHRSTAHRVVGAWPPRPGPGATMTPDEGRTVAGKRAKRAASTPVDPAILVASRVGKAIDGNVLLRPLDVSVAPGRCVVLRGENGSGKTTLLRILAGTLDPSEGSATVDGRDADERDPAVRETVAALIGAPTAYRDLTLFDHLVLIDATWGRGDGSDERAEGLLASLEIDHLSERFPHELSSGQQQLFHLAMVLGRPARVLLLDEPEQRLDTHKRGLLADLLVARKEGGAALVVACHDPELTARIADRVVDVMPA